MSGVGVCQRAAAKMVRSRPFAIVENASATRTGTCALWWYHSP